MAASIGLATGGGMSLTAIASTAGALFTLLILRRAGPKQPKKIHRKLSFEFDDGALPHEALPRHLTDRQVVVNGDELDHTPREHQRRLVLEVRFRGYALLEQVVREMEALPGLRRFHIAERAGSC